jgi:hypothetical protein
LANHDAAAEEEEEEEETGSSDINGCGGERQGLREFGDEKRNDTE